MGMGGKMWSKEQLSKMPDKDLATILEYITKAFNKIHRIVADIVEIQNERYHTEHFRS
jgi:lambda repressor-like predicted transcriptional regulator